MSALTATNLTKEYRLQQPLHGQLTMVALTQLTFTVTTGEYVGLIGANGAGKSTLLRLLAGTLSPTSGSVAVTGTPLAFLQMGAGFNADLSLTENIRIYGAFTGRRDWLVKQTAHILQFAGLADVAKIPFRDLSQGMQARLTLATIAYANPDIFLIDEALAVGDAQFRQRAVNRFLELKRQGKTLLLASHDMGVIRRLCERALVLDRGHLVFVGPTETALAYYETLIASGR